MSRLARSGGLATGRHRGDALFEYATTACAALIPITLIGIVGLLVIDAMPSIQRYGFSFFSTAEWDPVFEKFGAAAYVYGTLVTSLIGLLLATPVAVGAALFVAEYSPTWLRTPVAFLVEMLAAIPSIIYGLWGFFILAPIMRGSVEPLLKSLLGDVPGLSILVSGPAIGKDLLTGGVILAIMILPTIMSVSREILLAVPNTQREGMLALGATRWETIRYAVLPYARSGILGAAILGLGRALGETMAVTMVIGNSSTRITGSLFTPGYTLASAIANQFTEADKEIYFSAVLQVGLVLLIVAALVNVIARLLVWSVSSGPGGDAVRAG
ncbi:MAG: phosphate ABC transporter permease subunit PstC [Chloroflexota bacterium]